MPGFVDDILRFFGSTGETVARKPGMNIGRRATSRIGKVPIEFTREPMLGGSIVGEFDPNVNEMQIFVGEGRSPRQINRTILHEDIHNAFERRGEGDLTHDILRDPQNPDISLAEGDDELLRLIRMFEQAGLQ